MVNQFKKRRTHTPRTDDAFVVCWSHLSIVGLRRSAQMLRVHVDGVIGSGARL